MGWEERNGQPYYYRKRWQDGRCVSEYIGGGLRAEHTALIDAMGRARDAQTLTAERSALAATSAEHAALDAPIDELSSLLQRLTSAVLVSNGYHKHKGTWRRRRGD